ncbi:MAG: pirin family protein [Fibrobacteres bacterium]|nr:pirin family protein [Fibrobacterota bacterium]
MKANTVSNIRKLGFQWDPPNPFLFCVHHNDEFPAGTAELGVSQKDLAGHRLGMDFELRDGFRMYHGNPVPGFPVHPHRGFETITVVEKGFIDHSDSHGGRGRYGDGDVQWMTAGSGIQHAEMFPLLNSVKKNKVELFQIWLNLPKAKKFSPPAYKMLWNEDIPVYEEKDAVGRLAKIKLISGHYKKHFVKCPTPDSWAADENNEVLILLTDLYPNAEWELPATSKGLNRTVYFFTGSNIEINGSTLEEYSAADLKSDSAIIFRNGNTKSRMLILQAKPIDEQVVQHGPFVMNTMKEIEEAFADYRKTEFGGWPWDRSDPVHGKASARFAEFPDGTREAR